jgi:pimeloyl-ACP methyl ester carboxylesterase
VCTALPAQSFLSYASESDQATLPPYGSGTLAPGIRSRMVSNINGLSMHVLEAGFDEADRPLVVLLHGFPDLCYCWRKIMVPLAAAGYHVIAPDQRGYGRTTGWDDAYDVDLGAFSLLTMARDAFALIEAFGYRSVAAVVGHDVGSFIAAWCALIRPDVFRSVVLMSVPFTGPPALPFDSANRSQAGAVSEDSTNNLRTQLAALHPPRKFYQEYYRSREANDNLHHPPQGLHDFLWGYFYLKSADWKGNKPVALKSNTATELAQIPRYYFMDQSKSMAETVADQVPSPVNIGATPWLTEAELDVYVSEWGRTGFQGGLNFYRVYIDPSLIAQLQLFADRTIDVPSRFIAGKSDWAVQMTPGAVDVMRSRACTQMQEYTLLDGAGHWLQQEQPDAVCSALVSFLRNNTDRSQRP